MSNVITTSFLLGTSDVEVQVSASAISEAVYFAKCDTVCETPVLIGSYMAGDKYLIVELPMKDGTKVVAMSGEEGLVHDGKVVIELTNVLRAGQEIWVAVDTATCKTRSCVSVVVERVENGCNVGNVFVEAGTLTGEFVCKGINLYRLAWDGNGGKYAALLAEENCVHCGGSGSNGSGDGGDGGDGGSGDGVTTGTLRLQDTQNSGKSASFGLFADATTADNSRTGNIVNGAYIEWTKAHDGVNKVLKKAVLRYKTGDGESGNVMVTINGQNYTVSVGSMDWALLTINVSIASTSHVVRFTNITNFNVLIDYCELTLEG